MKKSIILPFCYIIAVVLGCMTTYMVKSYHPSKNKKKIVPDYVHMGNEEEKLNFVEYSKGLYLSDSTVLKHKEGMLATPKVVSEVALAILEDYYPLDLVQFNYPYYISKGMFDWFIRGSCEYNIEKDCMYVHVGLIVKLQRSNGMVIARCKL